MSTARLYAISQEDGSKNAAKPSPVKGLGNDMIEVQRIADIIAKHGERFLDRLFTKAEQAYCSKHRDAARHYAGRFAAKEAIVKALGTGISEAISWLDIQIINNTEGKPEVFLSPKAQARFQQPFVQLSISHCKDYALAVALWL